MIDAASQRFMRKSLELCFIASFCNLTGAVIMAVPHLF
jgi:hypothetical protein